SEYLSITAADDITTLELRVMRIDAAVNRGNSGGGLFNGQGELIGIVNAKIISDDVENIGYAIPSDIVLSAVDNIMRNCDGEENTTIKRCMVGVSLTVQDSKAVYSDSSKTTKIVETVKIQSISAGSAAEGKLEAGDIILSFSFKGKTYGVARLFTLVDFSLRFAQNDVVSFSVERGGELMDVEVTLSSVTEIQ
ncbi:MAG TPA: trypsin-like serine protease, partial [Clostridia bacterium]|nr:trypsin-like serine protease [Clostridia bacterium]